MKKSVYGMAIVLAFFLSSTAFADYVIKLKNGRTVETANYWEEKGEIKFQWQGGVASLPKRNIVSIVRVEEKFPDRTYREKEPSPAVQESPAEPEKLPGKELGRLEAPATGFKEKEIEQYRKEKAHYTALYEQAYQRYLDATSRRDEEAKKKAWEEFNRFGGKVVTLETEVRKRNNGIVPQWWKE